MNTFLVVLLVVFGVALLVVEIFLIPGIGAAGVFGIAGMVGAVVLAYMSISPMAGHVTLCAVILLSASSVYAFVKSKAIEKMALKTDISAKVDLVSGLDIHEGDTAVTSSRLAPMGKIRVGNTEVEAKVLSDFIDPETPVSIVRIEGNIVVVKPL